MDINNVAEMIGEFSVLKLLVALVVVVVVIGCVCVTPIESDSEGG